MPPQRSHWGPLPENYHQRRNISGDKSRTMVQSNKAGRLRWLGHVMRLEDDTPAKQALQEFLKLVKKPRGRPTTTWLKKISSDLSETVTASQV